MKKYLAPSLICLFLCLAGASAQVVTRALQLSQDTTGAFSVDTNLGVYFPAHILSTGTNRPAPTIAGAGTPTISGTDTSATVVLNGSTATVTFGQAYLSAPNCVVTPLNQSTISPVSYTPSTTTLAIVQASATAGNKYTYWCSGVN